PILRRDFAASCANSLLPIERRQLHHRRLVMSGPLELLTIFRETRNKSAMAQEELAVLDAHEAIKAVGASSGVVAESRLGDFLPDPFIGAQPLVAVKRLAREVAVVAVEVFAERIESPQPPAVPGRAPRRDEHPLLFVGVKPVAGVNGGGIV